MRSRDLVLLLAVTAAWGINFTVVDIALHQIPPLLFVAVRFVLVAFPAILFVPPPGVGWRWLVIIGLLLGVGDFGLLFIGLNLGMPAGLSSLIMQSQAVFALPLAMLLLRERPTVRGVAGLTVAVLGILVMAVGRRTGVPVGAFLIVIAAAVSWGAANVCTRMAQPSDGLRLMVWVSLVPPLPLAVMSVLIEGPGAVQRSIATLDWGVAAAVVYVVGIATFFGFGVWQNLLRRHPVSQVAPFSLLVPVFGIAAAWVMLGERPSPAEWAGIVLVLIGLAGLSLPARTRPDPPDPGVSPAGRSSPASPG